VPNIKSPYGMRGNVKCLEDGICWKCGKAIKVGTLNWSYNTQVAGKYSHQDCTKAEATSSEPKATEVKFPPVPEPSAYAQHDLEKQMLEALEALKQTKPIAPKPQAKPSWQRPEVPAHHKCYDAMRRIMNASKKRSIYIPGAPGSGKTYSIMQYAAEMKLAYYCQPLSETSTSSDLFGYISPMTNELVRTMFRNWYELGGVLDLPELDNTDPNLLTMINNAIDNGICGFPDGMIKRHDNAYLIANGNTDMRGPTSQFPGRRKLDASNVERFKFVPWSYDEQFELAYYGTTEENAKFVSLLHQIRKHCKASIEIVVSQRAILDGIADIEAGFTIDQALYISCFKMHPETEDIYNAIGRPFIPVDKLFDGGSN